jgi:hypothetical protein
VLGLLVRWLLPERYGHSVEGLANPNRVLVKRSVPATKTAGGIFLPESSGKKEMDAEVVAVGPGARDDKSALIMMDVKVPLCELVRRAALLAPSCTRSVRLI